MINEKELVLENIEKSYYLNSNGGSIKVLEGISLHVDRGEIVAILGASGCGKSTLLNIVAGFEKPSNGKALFMDEIITEPSPQRGVVFQSAALFPWLTVKQNIAYGLKLKKGPSKEIEERCSKYIKLVELEGFEDYYPNQLSGGMQQRVSLARVLILGPRMLLMDEPFAALDAQTRLNMQQLLLTISAKIGSTILFITHDIEEALILANKIYVMGKSPGKIIKEISVPFERPRPISIIGSIEFSKVKSEIIKLLFK